MSAEHFAWELLIILFIAFRDGDFYQVKGDIILGRAPCQYFSPGNCTGGIINYKLLIIICCALTKSQLLPNPMLKEGLAHYKE